MRVHLSKINKSEYKSIHRLIAEAFIPNPENKPQVNHIDNNPKNNEVDNLEWCTPKENMQHASKQGRMHYKFENLKKAQQSRKKPVIAIKDGEVLYFECIKEAEKYGFNHRHISNCCKKRYGCKTHKGYIWEYADTQ